MSANEAVIAYEEVNSLIIDPDTLNEPVIPKLPVIKADPVNGNPTPLPPPEPVSTVKANVLPSPFVNVKVFKLTEPVVNKEPVDTLPPPLPSTSQFKGLSQATDPES